MIDVDKREFIKYGGKHEAVTSKKFYQAVLRKVSAQIKDTNWCLLDLGTSPADAVRLKSCYV